MESRIPRVIYGFLKDVIHKSKCIRKAILGEGGGVSLISLFSTDKISETGYDIHLLPTPETHGKTGSVQAKRSQKATLKLDRKQSLFFLLSSSSRGKTSRKPARGILGKDETREARKIGTADNLLFKMKRVRQATQSCDWSVPEIAVNGFSFRSRTSASDRTDLIAMKLHQ